MSIYQRGTSQYSLGSLCIICLRYSGGTLYRYKTGKSQERDKEGSHCVKVYTERNWLFVA